MPQQQQTQPQPSPTPPKKKKIRVPRVVNGIEQMVEIEVDDVAGPTWGPNDKHTLLNHRLTRVDGPLKVSGAAVYAYDVRLPGMLYGRILRCPHAHARIRGIDTTKASRLAGVRAVALASELKGLPPNAPPPDELIYEGQSVAAVAAITPEIADDAIHAIAVQYEV